MKFTRFHLVLTLYSSMIIKFFSNHKFDENNEVVQKDKDRKDKKAKKKKKKDKKKNKGKVT